MMLFGNICEGAYNIMDAYVKGEDNMIECWHCKKWYVEGRERCPFCSYLKEWTLEEEKRRNL